MSSMDIVIGAAFGDEGKGLITHHLAANHGKDAIVVRYNGGAQAGHTVVTKYGQRHIFKHVGSGAFTGAKTFLSRFFVSNPILFLQELKELQRLNLNPKVYIDPESLVTTPYDMMINQIVEEHRGMHRHGSCGVGFGETIERNLYPPFALTVADLENVAKVSSTLQLIQTEWLPRRLAALNIHSLSEEWRQYFKSENILKLFIHDIQLFLEAITISRIDLTNSSQAIIFEGAQGLMLDQEQGWFPHVTRSHTGLKNVIKLIDDTSTKKINVVYVTRSYLTRHGAGPLPHELSTLPYKSAIDKTNVTNTYQGTLRYAWFNLSLLKSFIQSDLREVPTGIQCNYHLAVTCLDQIENKITYIENDKINRASSASFLTRLASEVNVKKILCSYGPTKETIKEWQTGNR